MIFARFPQRMMPVLSDERLLQHMEDFDRSETLRSARRMLKKHPEILSMEADALLAQRIAARRREAGDAAVFDLERRRIVLRRCREVGIEGAFREREEPALLDDPAPLIDGVVYAAIATKRDDETVGLVERHLLEMQGKQYHAALFRILGRIVSGERTEDLLVGLQVPDAMIVQQCLDQIAKRIVVQLPGGEGSHMLAELSGPLTQARRAIQRYGDTRDSGALDEALIAYAAIVSHPAAALEDRGFIFHIFGEAADALLERFRARKDTTDMSDLEEALSLWREACNQSQPGAPGRTGLLAGLGKGLRALYEVNGDSGTLDKAIEALQAAVAEAPEETLGRLSMEHELANTLMIRYRQSGNREDLDAAIGAYERIHGRIQDHSPLDRLTRAHLGMALSLRQLLVPDLTDLEQAIGLLEEAVRTTSPDAEELPGFLDGLGGALLERYQRAGDLADLDRAIENFGGAVIHPATDKYFAMYLNNLGAANQLLYARTNNPEHLRLAVDAFTDAVRFTPSQSPDRPMRLANLGGVLVQQYEGTRDANDIEKGIAALRMALERTPDESPEAAKRYNSLAAAFWTRYQVSHQPEDLDMAIEVAEHAADHASPHSFELPGYLNTLGLALQERADRTTTHEDLTRAIAAYKRCCELGMLTSSEVALGAARNWGNWASRRESWQEASEAYGYALQAAPQLLRTQLLREHKEVWLYAAQGIPTFAAVVLGRLGDKRGAVACLEQGRAFLLSEALQRGRADLEQLAGLGRDDLQDRYRQAADQVTRLEQESLTSGTASVSQRT